MGQKSLLLFVDIDEETYLRNRSYTTLPDLLALAIHKSGNGLALDKLYLLGNKQRSRVEDLAANTAIDYHHHAVTIYGERCTDPDCEEHKTSTVLDFNAYYTARNGKSSGLN